MIRSKLREECRKIARQYPFGYRVVFCNTEKKLGVKVAGTANSTGKTIYIENTLKSRPDVLGTLFHELGHAYCYHNKKYETYHKEIKNKNQLKKKLKQGIRAERYVDRWGQKELAKYDKRIKWVPTYFSKEDVNWYKNVWCPSVLKSWKIKNYL